MSCVGGWMDWQMDKFVYSVNQLSSFLTVYTIGNVQLGDIL